MITVTRRTILTIDIDGRPVEMTETQAKELLAAIKEALRGGGPQTIANRSPAFPTPNDGMEWTERDVAKLRSMTERREQVIYIAQALGRKPQAIYDKASALKIPLGPRATIAQPAATGGA
jgi:hypothetical protein